MDIPWHWALDSIKDLLPDETLTTLHDRVLTPAAPLLSTLLTNLTTLCSQTMLPLLDRLAALLASSPTIVSASAVLLLAVLILQVLSIVRRVMLFWTRLAFRLLFYAGAGLLASFVWQRGVERSLRDAVVVGSRVGGWVMGVVGVWVREYEKAQAMQQQQGQQGQYGQYGQQRGAGGGYGGYQHGQGRGQGRGGWR